MKKLVFTLMVIFFGAAGLMAQSTDKAKCSKEKSACCAKKKASTAAVSNDLNPKVLSLAKSIADKDETITTRKCADTGAVGFYKKNVCSESGKVSYDEVKFDEKTKTFVNTSPTAVENAEQGTLIKVVNMEDGSTSNATMDADAKTTKKACAKSGKKCCASKAKKTESGSQK